MKDTVLIFISFHAIDLCLQPLKTLENETFFCFQVVKKETIKRKVPSEKDQYILEKYFGAVALWLKQLTHNQ